MKIAGESGKLIEGCDTTASGWTSGLSPARALAAGSTLGSLGCLCGVVRSNLRGGDGHHGGRLQLGGAGLPALEAVEQAKELLEGRLDEFGQPGAHQQQGGEKQDAAEQRKGRGGLVGGSAGWVDG